MRTPPPALELRFLVPPHLADAARKAMAPYAVCENTTQPREAVRAKSDNAGQLTDQELAMLLGA